LLERKIILLLKNELRQIEKVFYIYFYIEKEKKKANMAEK